MATTTDIKELIKSLPTNDVILKMIDMSDNVPGGFSVVNLNFEELQKLLSTMISAIILLSDNRDEDAIIKTVINSLDTKKRVFSLRFDQSIQSDSEVTYFDDVYIIHREDERCFVISRTILNGDSVIWDTSQCICQVKDRNGNIINCTILTQDSNIIVNFQDVPLENYVLVII